MSQKDRFRFSKFVKFLNTLGLIANVEIAERSKVCRYGRTLNPLSLDKNEVSEKKV